MHNLPKKWYKEEEEKDWTMFIAHCIARVVMGHFVQTEYSRLFSFDGRNRLG